MHFVIKTHHQFFVILQSIDKIDEDVILDNMFGIQGTKKKAKESLHAWELSKKIMFKVQTIH